MNKEEIALLIEESSEKGAKKVLTYLGIDCDDEKEKKKAAKDFTDLRNLLDSYRLAKRTAFKTIVKSLTTLALSLALAALAVKLKLFGHG
jgi:hypothetical protein